MYHPILITHSVLRFVILLFVLIVIYNSIKGMMGKTAFSRFDLKMFNFLTIASHLQLVVGIVLYFISPFVVFAATTMKDSTMRYWTVEHITLMIIGIVVLTIGNMKLKKAGNSSQNHKKAFIYVAITTLIFVLGIFMSQRGFFHITI